MITYGKPTDLRLWYYGVAYFPTDPFEHVSHLIVLDAPLRCHSPNQDHQELYPKAPQAQAVTQSSTDLALPWGASAKHLRHVWRSAPEVLAGASLPSLLTSSGWLSGLSSHLHLCHLSLICRVGGSALSRASPLFLAPHGGHTPRHVDVDVEGLLLTRRAWEGSQAPHVAACRTWGFWCEASGRSCSHLPTCTLQSRIWYKVGDTALDVHSSPGWEPPLNGWASRSALGPHGRQRTLTEAAGTYVPAWTSPTSWIAFEHLFQTVHRRAEKLEENFVIELLPRSRAQHQWRWGGTASGPSRLHWMRPRGHVALTSWKRERVWKFSLWDWAYWACNGPRENKHGTSKYIKTTARHSGTATTKWGKSSWCVWLSDVVGICLRLSKVVHSSYSNLLQSKKSPANGQKRAKDGTQSHLQCIASHKPESCPGSKRTAEM